MDESIKATQMMTANDIAGCFIWNDMRLVDKLATKDNIF